MAKNQESSASPDLSRHAAEWGLAAAIIGGVLTILGPIAMFACLTYLADSASSISFSDLKTAQSIGNCFWAGLIAVALAGIGFGIKALRSASNTRQPAGLPVGGTLLSTLALFLLIIGVVALTKYIDSIRRSRGVPVDILVPAGSSRSQR